MDHKTSLLAKSMISILLSVGLAALFLMPLSLNAWAGEEGSSADLPNGSSTSTQNEDEAAGSIAEASSRPYSTDSRDSSATNDNNLTSEESVVESVDADVSGDIVTHAAGASGGYMVMADLPSNVTEPITISEATTIPAGATVTIGQSGSITVNSGVTLTVLGTINGSGTITIYGTLNNQGTIDGIGYIENMGVLNNSNTLVIGGTLDNSNTLQNSGSITGTGLVSNNSYAVFENTGKCDFGGSFQNNGNVDNSDPGSIYFGGTIENDGTIMGSGSITTSNGAYLTGNKIVPYVTAPTAAVGLIYNGSPQALLQTPGSTNGGTLQYDVAMTRAYSISLPEGTDAGTYIINYQVVGNDFFEDTDPVALTVTISPLKVNPTIILDPDSYTYDGQPKTPKVTVMADGATIPADQYTVEYSDNVEPGNGTVTVKSIENGNYEFEGVATFKISGKDDGKENDGNGGASGQDGKGNGQNSGDQNGKGSDASKGGMAETGDLFDAEVLVASVALILTLAGALAVRAYRKRLLHS